MDAATTVYSSSFYDKQAAGSYRSANEILPIVFDAVRPKSVIDIGCGIGTWLRSAKGLGADRVVGIDGDWVKGLATDKTLEIRHAHIEQPIEVAESFDLAMCLEVAEHLTPARARSFVADLTKLAPHVLFSAAIPGQGGHHHLNEQWQSYWAELFASHGFGARDIVRSRVRWRMGVEFWYRQNIILYSRGAPIVPAKPLDQVHPYQRIAWGIHAATSLFSAKPQGSSTTARN